jgi:hypothetical protein
MADLYLPRLKVKVAQLVGDVAIADGGTGASTAGAAILNLGFIKSHYNHDTSWTGGAATSATTRRTINSPNEVEVKIDTMSLKLVTQTTLDLNTAANWDYDATHADHYVGGDPATAANRAGRDFYIYMVQPASGTVPVILLSNNSTVPWNATSHEAYTASNSRKIGGFLCLCLSVGTISGHLLTGYLTGDILPASVWDLNFRPSSTIPGLVYDSQINKWVMIYLQSGTGASTASVFGATITDTRMQYDHVDDCAAVGCKLPDNSEFQSLSRMSNQESSISTMADPVTTGGHTAYELLTLDVAPGGAGWAVGDYIIGATSTKQCKIVEVLSTTTYIVKNRTGAFTLGEILNNSELLTLDVAPASPFWAAGNTITGASSGKTCVILEQLTTLTYLVKLRNGNFTAGEILSNGTTAADQGGSFPTVTTTIAADQGGSFPTVALDYTHGGRMISDIGCEDCCGVSSQWLRDQGYRFASPAEHTHSVTVSGDAQTVTSAVASANITPAYVWYDIGNKGSIYSQGVGFGDVKVRAGGHWTGGVDAGSRCRTLANFGWLLSTNVGARGLSDNVVK